MLSRGKYMVQLARNSATDIEEPPVVTHSPLFNENSNDHDVVVLTPLSTLDENSLDINFSTGVNRAENINTKPANTDVDLFTVISSVENKENIVSRCRISPARESNFNSEAFSVQNDNQSRNKDCEPTENDVSVLNSSENDSENINNKAEGIPRNGRLNSNESDSEHTSESNNNIGRPRKGRKRKYKDQTRHTRKENCNTNKAYFTVKGKKKNPRTFNNVHCHCQNVCNNKIDVEKRKNLFEHYWKLGTYESQTAYLGVCVKENLNKRKRTKNDEDIRRFTRGYYLNNIEVCKEMFIKTLAISGKRVNTALQKLRELSVPDKRGCAGGHNRLETETRNTVIRHIDKFPRYKSHYCRESKNKQEYLPVGVTVEKMYQLYKHEMNDGVVVSFSTYRRIFLTEFNLKSKKPKKDTCNKCDIFSTQIKSANLKETQNLKNEHEKHLDEASEARKLMNEDLKKAKENEEVETLTYDLEKTLPLPRIPTNIIYYKRQIMLYNAGIHSGKTDEGYFNIWLEGEAGRGAQEVGSCLKRHILARVDNKVTDLYLWSDSCGGQNRNIKIVLLLKAVLQEHESLQNIYLRYLSSGHTYLPNDSDFGDVECYIKRQQYMFSPEDYINLMKDCRKKKHFIVERMKKQEFCSTKEIEKKITNRKQNTDQHKVNWLKIKEIKICKNEPLLLFYKADFKEAHHKVINLQKNLKRRTVVTEEFWGMSVLWPQGKPISEKKLEDIKSYLNLIPDHLQEFYKNLTADKNVEDDIDGFNGDLDFEIEED